MTAKITWAVVTIACYGLILLGQPRAHDLFGFGGLDAALRYKWYYVLAYAAFGAPLLGKSEFAQQLAIGGQLRVPRQMDLHGPLDGGAGEDVHVAAVPDQLVQRDNHGVCPR